MKVTQTCPTVTFTNGGDELPSLLTETAHNHGCKKYLISASVFMQTVLQNTCPKLLEAMVRLSHDVG
jgi:hypothetical protein